MRRWRDIRRGESWIGRSKFQWWRDHSDWSVRLRLWFLYNGFRVGLGVEKTLRGAWSVAHILGWISRRDVTDEDIRWARQMAAEHGWSLRNK